MYTIRSIIPFNLLIDTDMGLVKYMQFAFSGDTEFCYPEILKMVGPEHTKFLQYALIHRQFINPLSVIIKEEKMLTCNPDKMVDDMFNKPFNKQTVLKLSTTTAIMNMVCKSFFLPEAMQFTILCNDDIEKRMLLEVFERHFKTNKVPAKIIVSTPDRVDLSEYGSIYIKDVHEISDYRHPIQGKNIIIAKYDFNLELDIENDKRLDLPLMDVINKYTSTNEVKFIDVYADIDNGVG